MKPPIKTEEIKNEVKPEVMDMSGSNSTTNNSNLVPPISGVMPTQPKKEEEYDSSATVCFYNVKC